MTDTDAPEPESAATRRWRLLLTGSIAAFLLLVGGVAVFSLPPGQGSPEAAVEGYLEALLNRDAEAALEYVDPNLMPTGSQVRFLDDRALDAGWAVSSIGRTEVDDGDAEVTASIAVPGRDLEIVFSVADVGSGDDEEWVLEVPFEMVETGGFPFDYLQVNDVAVERSRLGADVYLFPGVYDFYRGAKGVADIDSQRAAVFPDRDVEARSLDLGTVTPASATVDKTRKRFGELLDGCLEAERIDPYGCPFGLPEVDDPGDEHSDLSNLHDLAWSLDDQPRIGLIPDPEGDPGFAVVAETETTLTLTGTGVTADGRTTEFSAETELDFEGFLVVLRRDGSVSIENPDGARI